MTAREEGEICTRCGQMWFSAGMRPPSWHAAAAYQFCECATDSDSTSVVLAVDPSRSTPDKAVAPHPAPLGATAITDDDVRRAVCDYNDWKYDEMMSSVSLRDTRSLALRVVLESFAARSAPLGATDEGTVETRLIASLGQAVAIHRADRLRATATALVAMVDARLRQGDDPWWSAEQRAVWTAFRAAFTAAPTPDPLREAAQLVIDTWSAEPPLVDGFTAALTALRAALQAGG